VVRDEGKPAYRDSKRVLECLQRALKIADSVMDRNTTISLFVEILEQYLWYFERENEAVYFKF
jgi:vacuolar protein sorting-associated protein 35